MLRKILDILTLGVTARLRAVKFAQESMATADSLIAELRSMPPRYSVVRQYADSDPDFTGYVAQLRQDPRWQWFWYVMRERFVKQACDGTRQQTGDKDVYIGAMIAMDIINAKMQEIASVNERLTTNGSADK